MSESSTNPSCNTTRCSLDRFNCYARASSRLKRRLPTSKRCVITGWPEETSGRFWSAAYRVPMGWCPLKQVGRERWLIKQGIKARGKKNG